MKKNPKPLTYLVHPSLMETDDVQKLIQKGHTVISGDMLVAPDLVVGPNCYRLSKETIHLLDMATKSARASKYPRSKHGEESLGET